MFDLVTAGRRHPFHDPTVAPTAVSLLVHGGILLAVVVLPIMAVTDHLPEVPAILAFVAEPVTAPPPPPPPPPPKPRGTAEKPRPTATTGALAAPVEAPADIRPEPVGALADEEFGVEGGVEGGIIGGIPGGIVGGLIESPALAPPPPPAPPKPVRIGGQITVPALIHRVEPKYPDLAVLANVSGIVILEAVVRADGSVESVKVLRSIKMLDAAAIEAVQQWRYSPLVLNGVPTPFIVTVTLTFRFK